MWSGETLYFHAGLSRRTKITIALKTPRHGQEQLQPSSPATALQNFEVHCFGEKVLLLSTAADS